MAVQDQKIKYVFASNEVPDECVKQAQVVIVGKFSWHIIAPAPYRMHCLMSFAPVPTVACPVVDVTGVTDDEGMAWIIKNYTDPSVGVINMDGLLNGLVALGGKAMRLAVQVQKAVGGRQRVN